MKTTTIKNSIKILVLTGTCITTMFVVSASSSFASDSIHGTTTTGSCLFSAQLETDPLLRSEFTDRTRGASVGVVEVDADEDSLIYNTDIKTKDASISFNRSGASIDRLSNDCLACHDGVAAQNFKIRIKNNPAGRVMNLEDIIGGHPVGMEYDRYLSYDSNGYKRDVKFSGGMLFAEGKVGCLTCHNPLNKEKGHLVMNNDKSELCFACHAK